MTGDVFGPYRLSSLIGRGGMGEVWQAVDTVQGDRRVTLKLLGSWLRGDPQFARRFQRESAMGRHHPRFRLSHTPGREPAPMGDHPNRRRAALALSWWHWRQDAGVTTTTPVRAPATSAA